jgi:hypothetical protein
MSNAQTVETNGYGSKKMIIATITEEFEFEDGTTEDQMYNSVSEIVGQDGDFPNYLEFEYNQLETQDHQDESKKTIKAFAVETKTLNSCFIDTGDIYASKIAAIAAVEDLDCSGGLYRLI